MGQKSKAFWRAAAALYASAAVEGGCCPGIRDMGVSQTFGLFKRLLGHPVLWLRSAGSTRPPPHGTTDHPHRTTNHVSESKGLDRVESVPRNDMPRVRFLRGIEHNEYIRVNKFVKLITAQASKL